ncbi:MAG: transporter substrate-binding domain-containing protein [gamma proteobacterium symbiont of Taylorina sp.]|nr:transporter substrate-binding domain-containing protein [gamma proteobacterium symbiont of Taylorina sp.]
MINIRFNSLFLLLAFSLFIIFPAPSYAQDLAEIKKSGVLRHLGIPYANFITGSDDGLDVELMKNFASYLGIKYQFVKSDWRTIFGDLTGRHARRGSNGAELLEPSPIIGDVIANGMTVLPWREQLITFSEPTFPSSVWLIARAESNISPIKPSRSLQSDILLVKQSLDGVSVLALENTCLDPALYQLSKTKAEIRLLKQHLKLNEMAPAILNNEAETTLLDVPDALIALEKWPGQLKVIGPISQEQVMGAGFRKNSPQLLHAFNQYLKIIRKDGTYNKMVKKYYPSVFLYYADFFNN